MKKRLPVFVLALYLLAALAMPAAAAEATETAAPTNVPREPGFCGEKITWDYVEGTLTISGTGEMDDFPEGTPWEEYRMEIKKVVFTGGVTYIGACSFKNNSALETVDFGGSLYEIGREAFASCDGLTAIELPASFKIFGEACFQNCRNLKEIHCQGKFPSFRQNCLWGTCATIYYPAERPWSVTYIEQLETAFNGRIEFLASDGTDPYHPEEPETQPEETVPPASTAAPETQPDIPATAAPTSAPETAVPTQKQTEAPTQVPTAPVQQEETDGGSGMWIGILIVGIVLLALLLGALVFRGTRPKGKFSA